MVRVSCGSLHRGRNKNIVKLMNEGEEIGKICSDNNGNASREGDKGGSVG